MTCNFRFMICTSFTNFVNLKLSLMSKIFKSVRGLNTFTFILFNLLQFLEQGPQAAFKVKIFCVRALFQQKNTFFI